MVHGIPRHGLPDSAGHSERALGPTNAPVTIVEYGDFECPTCKQTAPAVKLLLKEVGDRVRFGFRHFPIAEAHPHAVAAAECSEAAGAQGKFWPMHDLLFENQRHLKAHDLREYAVRLALDIERYDYEIADHVYLQRVREDMEAGHANGVRAAPSFFVDGAVVDISFGVERLFTVVRAALAAPGSHRPR